MSKRILVVDDKANVRQMTREVLTAEGFSVLEASNGQEALYVARGEKPDLILLDVMMPEMGGYEFLRIFRKEHETPVILLTAKMDEADKVLGLELGADDYVTKPFGMKELVARIHAVLRRSSTVAASQSLLTFAGIRLDPETRDVSVDGKQVSLSPSEFELLKLLLSSPGRVYPRSEILFQLQGTTFEGLERSIDVHVRNLRAKIEQDPANPRYIETVFGIGYKLSSQANKNDHEALA